MVQITFRIQYPIRLTEMMQASHGDIPVRRELPEAEIPRIWVLKVPEIFTAQDGGQPVKEVLNTVLK